MQKSWPHGARTHATRNTHPDRVGMSSLGDQLLEIK